MNKHNHYSLFLGILFAITCFNAFAQDKILEPIPFALVKEKPLFQGGDIGKFSTWVKSHLSEKVIAPEYVGKRVTAQVLVNVDGSLSAKIIRGVSDTIDKEIVKIIESSPKWQPGRNNDTVVPVNINMPIIIPGREETNVGIQKNTNRSSTNNSSTTTVAGEKAGDISLVVNGEGATKTEATKNALRSAIEQAFGVFVSASTEILNDELVRDEIATVASGNIKSYKELSSMALPNGNSSVTLSAIVSIGNLVQYAQSHGSSAEFAGQAFLMNMRMQELNKQNEAIAIKNLYTKLLQLKPVLYDCTLDVGDPRKTELYQYRGGSTGVTPIGSGYCVPLRIDLTPTDNLINWLRELESTLSTLSLNEEEVESIERNGIHTYRFNFFNKKYNLRNCYASYKYKGDSEHTLSDCVEILNAWFDAWIIKLNTGEEFYSVPKDQLRDGLIHAISRRTAPSYPVYIDTYDFVYMSESCASSVKSNNVPLDYPYPFDPDKLWTDDNPMSSFSLHPYYLGPLNKFSPFERWHVYFSFELFFPEKKLENITSFSVDWNY